MQFGYETCFPCYHPFQQPLYYYFIAPTSPAPLSPTTQISPQYNPLQTPFSHHLNNPSFLLESYPSSQHSNTSSNPKSHRLTPKNPSKKVLSEKVPGFKYAKKNAQSNIVNQIFSYLSIRAKSEELVERLLGREDGKMGIYYELMRNIKKKNRKYINRTYLKNLIELEKEHSAHAILRKIDHKKVLPVERLRSVLRVMVHYYLQNICTRTILTSSKLDPLTRRQHLKRRREVHFFLLFHLSHPAN